MDHVIITQLWWKDKLDVTHDPDGGVVLPYFSNAETFDITTLLVRDGLPTSNDLSRI